MTNDELTTLWREAGEIWLDGMRGHVPGTLGHGIRISTIGSGTAPWHCFNFMGSLDDLVPDWSHPTTEHTMMCAAEHAVGEPLYMDKWPNEDLYDIYRESEVDGHRSPKLLRVPGPRVAAWLRVIIACRKGGA